MVHFMNGSFCKNVSSGCWQAVDEIHVGYRAKGNDEVKYWVYFTLWLSRPFFKF
jgi:hypothetical protein